MKTQQSLSKKPLPKVWPTASLFEHLILRRWSKREWRFYLDDMIGFAENVLAYTSGLDQAEFESTDLNHDATFA